MPSPVIDLMSALKRSRAQETPAKGGRANKQEKRTRTIPDRRQPSLLLPVAGGGKRKGTGLTILTALGQLLPFLSEEETHLALFHGARRVAADCDGATPSRERAPLASRPDLATLKRWLRRWVAVRHRDAAERTVLTAIAGGASPAALADLLFAAETDRAYADGGHSLDFINKAFECLDVIGWEHAADVLPSIVGQMAAARGAEERTAWRQPVDLIALCQQAGLELPQLFAARCNVSRWSDHVEIVREPSRR